MSLGMAKRDCICYHDILAILRYYAFQEVAAMAARLDELSEPGTR